MKRFSCFLCIACLLLSSIMVHANQIELILGRIDAELLSVLEKSEEELVLGHFDENGELFPCMIWITDIDMEPAVRYAIDQAELTREKPRDEYDYPYEVIEEHGVKDVVVDLSDDEDDVYIQTYIESKRKYCIELYQEHNMYFADSKITYNKFRKNE